MSFSFGGTTAAAPAASSGFSFGAAAPAAAGSSAAPAPAGGSFSFGTTTPAPSTGGGFSFGSSTGQPSAVPTSSGGFGFGTSTGTSAGTTGSSGFSFGSGTSTSTAARSLFGSTPSTGTAMPATGGSLFSSTPAAAPSTGTGSFSFGAAPAAPATGTGSSLFGGTGTGGSSLFGGTNTVASAAGGTSLFGSNPSGGSSLFGSSSLTTTPGAAPATGSSFALFGGAAGAPAQSGQGITLETPFDTLPADIKKNIVEFHHFLKEQDQSDAFLKTVSPRKLEELDENIQQLEQDVLVRRNIQDRQATAVHHLRKDVKKLIHQVDNASLSLRTLDGNSALNMYHIMRHVETPSPYYWDLLDHFEAKMETIKTQIEDIESEFKPLYERRTQHGSGASQASLATMSPALLHQIMLSQNAALMQVAARVAEVHERADEMRQQFLVKMRQDLERRGDYNPAAFKNPFEQRKKNAHEDKRHQIDKIRFRTNVAPTIVSTTPAAPAAAAPQLSTGGGFGFGTTPAATTATMSSSSSLFGSTTTSTAAPSTGSSLFGSTTTAAAPSTTTTGSGFSFGVTSTAPKQVSFNLSTSAAPAAPAVAAPMSTLSAFSVPSVSTTATPSAFGGVASSFLPGATTGDAEKRVASSRRGSGRPKKRA